ncbi:dephospho-CoA kinase [Sphingobium sp. SYK-6]|uniref:dephospho-CoA kinase n=1 Tax=Sphingobium sp. (strain NBRC 103272 / SYK-6) TaxID=627192 RepID=UPI00022768E9|nr:dephospho-CoA kinase [Sphingobium sp. SYK-6]BAK64679.1 dephospho-CoA kinase [Sphingobium sp. SYK-6]
MPHRPFRLGLTGSIGMGKSAVAGMMRAMGVPVFDTDAQVHRLQGPDGALIGAIEARFPGTTGAGGVDRQALGARVIGQPEEMAALEAIVHPAVRSARRDFLARHRAYPIVLLDIPLLFETRAERGLDMVAVVSAPFFLQRRRVMARPGMTEARFRRIRASQMPDHVKRARADVVIETGCPKWRTRAQVRGLIACLRRSLVR